MRENLSSLEIADSIRLSSKRGRNVVVVTGDTEGLFPGRKGYVNLEETIQEQMSSDFDFLSLDINGVDFYEDETLDRIVQTELEVRGKSIQAPARRRLFSQNNDIDTARESMAKRLVEVDYNPLTSLALLRSLFQTSHRAVNLRINRKPLCLIVRRASLLFPNKPSADLSDPEKQRLMLFLNWVSNSEELGPRDLVVLVNQSRSDVKDHILDLLNVQHLEIPLPGEFERLAFLRLTAKDLPKNLLELTIEQFASEAAGLRLATIGDLMQGAKALNQPITRAVVAQAINEELRARLGNVVSFKPADHGPAEVDGYDAAKTILREVMEDCADPNTAIPAILVAGPNGGGKTWIVEGLAPESGRVVIELTGLRNELFGGTERFFEQFRLVASTFGSLLVEMDEAHTVMGSVHRADTHEVEKRLSGNIIKMMSDPRFLGKVLWVLMTSRPDELDPDIKSRCPIQVGIFDLEGEARQQFVTKQFDRKKIELSETEIEQVMVKSQDFSNRDYSFLVSRFAARRKRSPNLTISQFLETWQAGDSIKLQRRLQSLIAAEHCTFPNLLPDWIKKIDAKDRVAEIQNLKWLLGYS